MLWTAGSRVVAAIAARLQWSAPPPLASPHLTPCLPCGPTAGSVLFAPAATQLTYTASAAGPLKVWVAACNGKVFAPVAVPAEAATAQPEPALVAA